ncbi:competence protein CoiA [Bacillus toyonensis]|uniref:competence protein CoiA n=1 Tax=Bacillus toyonensis TaxID=155322 RepID=UPI002E21956A|nr:competence protein CoiA family protein [Bacillus toyonensis]
MLRCITNDEVTLYAPSCKEVETRELSKNGLLFCPSCKEQVQFCRGPKKGSYFRHPKSNCIAYKYDYAETPNHKKGKDILFNWLKNRFENAIVEKEKYIPETSQIADILLTHTDGEFNGEKWAFEYQHSSLPEIDWQTRHNLYQKAGIKDFWILDAQVFLKYSTSEQGSKLNVRKKKEPQEAIFNTTGFCYFLNIETDKLTIDYKFEYTQVKVKNKNGKYYDNNPKLSRFHKNSNQSCNLNDVRFKYDDEFKFPAMYYNGIGKEFFEEFDSKIRAFKRQKQKKWEEKLEIRIGQKVQYAQNNYDEDFSSSMKKIIEVNKQELQYDAYQLTEGEFLQKYEVYAERLQKYEKEMLDWKERGNVKQRIIYRLCNSTIDDKERRNLEFLKKSHINLEEHYNKKYENKIKVVLYVYQKYESLFVKLALMLPDRIEKRLRKINSRIVPFRFETRPTKIDYAFVYHFCESEAEAELILNGLEEKLDLPIIPQEKIDKAKKDIE